MRLAGLIHGHAHFLGAGFEFGLAGFATALAFALVHALAAVTFARHRGFAHGAVGSHMLGHGSVMRGRHRGLGGIHGHGAVGLCALLLLFDRGLLGGVLGGRSGR